MREKETNKKYLSLIILFAIILAIALFLNWELNQPIFSDAYNSTVTTSIVTSCSYDWWTSRTNIYLNNGLHLHYNGNIGLLVGKNYTITYRTDSYRLITWHIPDQTELLPTLSVKVQCQFEGYYFENKSIGILLNRTDLMEVHEFSKPYEIHKSVLYYEIGAPARFLFQWRNGTAIGYKDFYLFPKMSFDYLGNNTVIVCRLDD